MIPNEILKDWLEKRTPTLIEEGEGSAMYGAAGQLFVLVLPRDSHECCDIFVQPGILGDSTADLPTMLEYLDHFLDDTPEQAAALEREQERKRGARQPGGLMPVHLDPPDDIKTVNFRAVAQAGILILGNPDTAAVLRHYAPTAYHDLRVAMKAAYAEPNAKGPS